MLELPESNPQPNDRKGFKAPADPKMVWESALKDSDKLLKTNDFLGAKQAIAGCFKEAVRLWGEGSLQKALCVERYAELHIRWGNVERAFELYRALSEELGTASHNMWGKDDQDSLRLCSYRVNSRQAELLLQLGRNTEALSAIDNALAAIDCPDLRQTSENRTTLFWAAKVSFDLSRWSDAEMYLLRSLSLHSHGYDAVDARHLLAQTYQSMGRYGLGLSVLQPAISAMSDAPPSEHNRTLRADLLWQRGLLLHALGKPKESILDHEEADQLLARSIGPYSQQAIRCRCSLAEVLMHDGQLHRARQIIDRAISCARDHFGEHSEEVFTPLRLQALLCLALAKSASELKSRRDMPALMLREEAEEQLIAAQLACDIPRSEQWFAAKVRATLLKQFLSDCRATYLHSARGHLLSAAHIYIAAEQPHHPALIGVYNLLGRVSKLLREPRHAEMYFKKAREISERGSTEGSFPSETQ